MRLLLTCEPFTMSDYTLSYDEFIKQAKELASLSEVLCDGWLYIECDHPTKQGVHLKKQMFLLVEKERLKMEYIVSYSTSYAVPLLSFNVWRDTGALLALDELTKISQFRMDSRKELYSAVTQQEHHLFHRPYFTVHPCHTASLLATQQNMSSNIIMTFLSLLAPLVGLPMSLQYAVISKNHPG